MAKKYLLPSFPEFEGAIYRGTRANLGIKNNEGVFLGLLGAYFEGLLGHKGPAGQSIFGAVSLTEWCLASAAVCVMYYRLKQVWDSGETAKSELTSLVLKMVGVLMQLPEEFPAQRSTRGFDAATEVFRIRGVVEKRSALLKSTSCAQFSRASTSQNRSQGVALELARTTGDLRSKDKHRGRMMGSASLLAALTTHGLLQLGKTHAGFPGGDGQVTLTSILTTQPYADHLATATSPALLDWWLKQVPDFQARYPRLANRFTHMASLYRVHGAPLEPSIANVGCLSPSVPLLGPNYLVQAPGSDLTKAQHHSPLNDQGLPCGKRTRLLTDLSSAEPVDVSKSQRILERFGVTAISRSDTPVATISDSRSDTPVATISAPPPISPQPISTQQLPPVSMANVTAAADPTAYARDPGARDSAAAAGAAPDPATINAAPDPATSDAAPDLAAFDAAPDPIPVDPAAPAPAPSAAPSIGAEGAANIQADQGTGTTTLAQVVKGRIRRSLHEDMGQGYALVVFASNCSCHACLMRP
jgi:hypothetical protein